MSKEDVIEVEGTVVEAFPHKSFILTVFIGQNLPVLSKQQSYMRHRFYGRV